MSHPKQWVYFFGEGGSEGNPDMRAVLGGKGASLAAMSRAGLPVPPGFTISTECCRHFSEHDEEWPAGLEEQVRENLARLEAATGRVYGKGPDPLLLAVRSGAAVSMPGMMDTILNCGLHAEPVGQTFPTEPWEMLVESINAVFRSWDSARAVAYRKRNDVHGLLGTAVNVQSMFPSQVSGVLFTVDPNHPSTERMVIESTRGLGDAVVSGHVTPDRLLVERRDLAASSRAQRSESLAPEQIAELCELGLRVESHFGAPMDLEWGWAEGRFALLQCRPIRGLDVAADVEVGRQAEIDRLQELAAGKRRLWLAHNLGETLRTPTPLTWDIVGHFMSGEGGFGRMYTDLGFRPSPEVRTDGFLELICGRLYADPERLAQLFWEHMPLAYDLEAVLEDPSQLDRAPTRFDPQRADGWFFLRLPGMIRAMLRSSKLIRRGKRTAKSTFEDEVLPPFLEYVRQKRAEDLSALTLPEFTAELHERRTRVLDELGKESLKPGFFAGLAFGELEGLLVQLMGKDEGSQLARTLTAGLEGDVTVEQNRLLGRVAAGEMTMAEFLERFGHRAVGEMELSVPRWREDPEYLEQVVASIRSAGRGSPDDLHEANVRARVGAESRLADTLARWGGSSLRELVEENLHLAQALLPYREAGKHYLMMGYELIRLAILELSRRCDLGRDIFFLRLAELERLEADRERLLAEVAQRKIRWQSAQRLDLPDLIDSERLAELGRPQQYDAVSELSGDPIAPGVAAGPARVVLDPSDAHAMGVDYILVCPSTDPGWTPLFINARGLVVERGGTLSHGAIVARDFGIPAAVCANATSRIPDGSQIRLDGNRGLVTIVDDHSQP